VVKEARAVLFVHGGGGGWKSDIDNYFKKMFIKKRPPKLKTSVELIILCRQ